MFISGRKPLQLCPDPGIEPVSLISLALADGFFTTSATWEALPGLRIAGAKALRRGEYT